MGDVEFINLHTFPGQVVLEVVETGSDIDLEVSSYEFEIDDNGSVSTQTAIPEDHLPQIKDKLYSEGLEWDS